ncbi:hypothetical protein M514_02166 [Trichuris suis]|uniref:Uncharacterized protein n=1 Tax=Trichuris suis TaxID=68888 RepID=A0A085MI63_9BILA|nr:hypothetical protein M513_02166 [Trichuris suis]KFD66149.1 hypothetical protein M514_02166 [Trichuris suis]
MEGNSAQCVVLVHDIGIRTKSGSRLIPSIPDNGFHTVLEKALDRKDGQSKVKVVFNNDGNALTTGQKSCEVSIFLELQAALLHYP